MYLEYGKDKDGLDLWDAGHPSLEAREEGDALWDRLKWIDFKPWNEWNQRSELSEYVEYLTNSDQLHVIYTDVVDIFVETLNARYDAKKILCKRRTL